MTPAPSQPDPRRDDLSSRRGRKAGPGEHDEGLAGEVGGLDSMSRLDELLIDRATVGLDAAEEAELRLLLDESGRTSGTAGTAGTTGTDDTYEMLTAAMDLAMQPPAQDEKLPVQLRNRILAAGDVWLNQRELEAQGAGSRSVRGDARVELLEQTALLDDGAEAGVLARIGGGMSLGRVLAGVRRNAGWLTAAACLALAVLGWTRPTNTGTLAGTATGTGTATIGSEGRSPMAAAVTAGGHDITGQPAAADVGTRLARFMADNHDDLKLLPLALTSTAQRAIGAGEGPTEDLVGPPAGLALVSAAAPVGEVIWSSTQQAGFLRLSGLPALKRPGDQYQLWIVDALRDPTHPVSAGVFDVPFGASEVLLPVNAAVRVDHAVRFSITVERSGGSVTPSLDSLVVEGGDDVARGEPDAPISIEVPAGGARTPLKVNDTAGS